MLAVVVGALGFTLTSWRLSDRTPVLEVAVAVPAGGVLTGADLRSVRVAVDSTVATVAASAESGVLGRTVAVPLQAGELLSGSALGPATFPPAGQVEVALEAKSGQFPPDLTAGDRVTVVLPASGSSGSSAGTTATGGAGPVDGLVIGVSQASDTPGAVVIELMADRAGAEAIAAASTGGSAGSTSISVLISPAGGV